jgi:signal transduction histidine kinase
MIAGRPGYLQHRNMDSPDANTLTTSTPDYAFNKLWLRFPDAAVERAFEREEMARARYVIRIYVAAGVVLYSLFGVLDLVVGGNSIPILLLIRFGLVCPVMLTTLTLSFFPVFPRIGQIALGCNMAASGLGVIAMTAVMPAPFNAQYFAGLLMCVLYCSSLIRLRIVIAALISLAFVGLYQLSALWLNPIPFATYVSNNFYLVMATGVGLFSGYFQEFYVRKSYVSQKLIEAKNETLSVLLVRAEEANRSKSNFLATMSHELRTPLNAIIGFSEILKGEFYGVLGDARYRDYAGDINTSGLHLLAIINDILDLAKVEAGKLELREDRTDLGRCLETSLQFCRLRAAEANVEIRVSTPKQDVYALADDRLLRQMLLNLLSNAIKFTPAGGRVHVLLEASAEDGIVFEVRDTGIGIRPEHLERVMRPFEQVEPALSRRHGGTGLGLHFAKKIAELHGGTIALESAVGKGTRVRVWLPPGRLLISTEAPLLLQAV